MKRLLPQFELIVSASGRTCDSVVEKSAASANEVTAKRSTVALRMPAPVAAALLDAAGAIARQRQSLWPTQPHAAEHVVEDS